MPTYTGRLRTRWLLWTWIAARSSSKVLALAKAWLAIRRLSLSSSFARDSFTSMHLRRFSKDTVVHELVGVLEVAGSPFLELCVHPDIGLQPGALPEAEGAVDLRETHAQREVELQDTVVKHVTVLVAEVRHHFSTSVGATPTPRRLC